MRKKSIFEKYYTKEKFIDRYKIEKEGVDVIIPLINTNELWRRNLFNFYQQIPIHRLLIGDGGCTDDSIDIVKRFPRVTVLNHKKCKSQGGSIIDLIKNVTTDWFIYLHADVFLPDGWYKEMKKKQDRYDWFECKQRITTMIEYAPYNHINAKRAYSGSQMGRRKAFNNIVKKVDDDYLQRNEDIILAELIKKEGFMYGINKDIFNYHQAMNRKGEQEPKFETVVITKKEDKEWEKRIWDMQARGIIKYLQPKKYLIDIVNTALPKLNKLEALNWIEFKNWVKDTNHVWLKHLRKKGTYKYRFIRLGLRFYNWLEK